jgi:hypothetical protein
MAAGSAISRRHLAKTIPDNMFDPKGIDGMISIAASHSTQNDASYHLEADRKIGRLAVNRLSSPQNLTELALWPVELCRRQLQSEPVLRPHHGTGPDLTPDWDLRRNRQWEHLSRPDHQAKPVLRYQIPVGHPQVVETHASALTNCQVCFDEITTTNQPPLSISTTCSHARNVICQSCLEQHITSQAALQNWDLITAPKSGLRPF